MATERSLSGLAKASELQKIVLQLQKFSNKSAQNNRHRVAGQMTNHQSSQNSHLPFQILSIDSVSGQDFASVQYQHDTQPIRLNDQLAGWKLVRLDALQGIAVWENAQRRRVTIVLRNMHYV